MFAYFESKKNTEKSKKSEDNNVEEENKKKEFVENKCKEFQEDKNSRGRIALIITKESTDEKYGYAYGHFRYNHYSWTQNKVLRSVDVHTIVLGNSLRIN